jgi:hypothetical protein
MPGQKGGHGHRICLLAFHARKQGPQSAKGQMRIKRRTGRTDDVGPGAAHRHRRQGLTHVQGSRAALIAIHLGRIVAAPKCI